METPSTHSHDFYVTLPSNTSKNFFPENRAHSYRTKLAHPIQLQGNWEVGLAEIQYMKAFKTLTRGVFLSYQIKGDAENEWFPGVAEIPAGYYKTPKDIIDVLLKQLDEEAPISDHIQIAWSQTDGKIYTTLSERAFVAWNDPVLQKMFGIDDDMQYLGPGKFVSARPANIKRGFYSLFVYTDIISPVLVGDAAVPLLKIVPIDGDYGEMTSHTYSKLHYVPILRNYFDTIEINIAKDSGKPVHFLSGKVVVKLHIRPRKLAFM